MSASCRKCCLTLFFVAALAAATAANAGAIFYVSSEGEDSHDGKSPETAWKTLEKVNAAPLLPGDSVLFRRGDFWRGSLRPHNGEEGACILYGAFGSGEKPGLLGSIPMDTPDLWQDTGHQIWESRPPGADKAGTLFPCDVGNIIFDQGRSCGVKVWEDRDLDRQGKFRYDPERHCVMLFSSKNPALQYASIECALREHVIAQNNAHHVVYEDLAVRYGAAHGIGGANTHHITVRRCDFSFIGGGDQSGGGKRVRFGNGVEFWANAHDNLVEQCRLWEIYDAALTNQNSGERVQQFNLVYRYNVIWNCEYSFEYWNRPENSLTHDVCFENNTCVNAGAGWGHAQRPDPSGRHLCFYDSPAPAQNIVIRNNIFFEAAGNALYAPTWSEKELKALVMDYNCWFQHSGVMALLKPRNYTMPEFPAYQSERCQEQHSITADPLFADAAFHLPENSPCVDKGLGLGPGLDIEGRPVPQGPAADIGALEFSLHKP